MSISNDYSDQMPMPFGKHIGTPLGKLPPSYLIWLYKTSENGERLSDKKLANYIKANLHRLELEVISQYQQKWFERQ